LVTANSRRLLREAERCFRLANGIASVRLSDELEAIGREFEREALRITHTSGPDSPIVPYGGASRNQFFDLDQR
jgi:hypothetical protein